MSYHVVRTIAEAPVIDARPAVAPARAEVACSAERAQVEARIAEDFAVEARAAEVRAPALRIVVGVASALGRVTTSQMNPHNEGILPACRSPQLPSEAEAAEEEVVAVAVAVAVARVAAQWRPYPRSPTDLRTNWPAR